MIIDQPLSCTYQAIVTDVPLQLWDARNTYFLSGMAPHINRIWLNTPALTVLNLAQCGAHYVSPSFFYSLFGVLGVVVWVGGLFVLTRLFRRNRILTIAGVGLYLAVMIGEWYR